MLLTTISLKGCHSIFCHVLPHQPFGKLLCHHLILCFIFMALGFTVEMFPASSVVLFLDGVHNHKKAPEYHFYFSKLSMKHSTDFYIFFFSETHRQPFSTKNTTHFDNGRTGKASKLHKTCSNLSSYLNSKKYITLPCCSLVQILEQFVQLSALLHLKSKSKEAPY